MLRLNNKLREFTTPSQRRRDLEVYEQKFNEQEYLSFLRKFRGSLIFRGKSSLSYKLFDRIQIILRKEISKKRGEDPEVGLEIALFNLIPIIGMSNVRRGRKIQTVPVFLKPRKRIVLINKWLISSQKNKSNVRGIKIDNIAKLLLLALIKKGNAYGQKIEYVKKAFSLRYRLLRQGKRINKRAFNNFQEYILKKLQSKHGEKKEFVSVVRDVKMFISSMKFLTINNRFKSYKIKKSINRFRRVLFESWDLTPIEKIFILFDWLFKYGYKNKLQMKRKEIDQLKKRYYKLWKEKKKQIY